MKYFFNPKESPLFPTLYITHQLQSCEKFQQNLNIGETKLQLILVFHEFAKFLKLLILSNSEK